jgi:signal transduction histidine kinase
MLAMVESILEINRMESGKLELSLNRIDLPALVNETISELQITATDYQVTVTLEAEAGIPQIVLDKNKIQRVINNLIDNALKFSPDGGQVLVKVVPSDEVNIEIHVLDRGPGIPDEYSQSIFDRFFQIPGHSSRKRGTGLGLTYCKLITEAHHGRIWVKNRTGGGSDFGLSLPISGP